MEIRNKLSYKKFNLLDDKKFRFHFVDHVKDSCDSDVKCGTEEYSFRIISGAASVVGPRICWKGEDIIWAKVNKLRLFVFLLSVESFDIAAN